MNPHKTRFFRHYKNKPYRYLGLVRHSETLEEMALYETLYENKLGHLWVRPKNMFFENVVIEGQQQARFKPVEFTFKTFQQFEPEWIEQFKSICKASFNLEFDEAKYLSKIQLHKKFQILVAFDGTEPVGIKIGYQLNQSRFYSWIGAVLPSYRGLGIASELMSLQHHWCREQHFRFIETRTRNSFKKMLTLNLSHGFEIVGTLKDSMGIKILLEKDLSK